MKGVSIKSAYVFQPAPPARRATRQTCPAHSLPCISTRAPRTEGDRHVPPSCLPSTNFNPRPPHGGRLDIDAVQDFDISIFQPAPPARRATPTAYLVVTQHETGPFART